MSVGQTQMCKLRDSVHQQLNSWTGSDRIRIDAVIEIEWVPLIVASRGYWLLSVSSIVKHCKEAIFTS